MKFTLITNIDFDQKEVFLRSGLWVILHGKDSKTELIFTELSQSVLGPNFGIYSNSKTQGIIFYQNSKIINSYKGPITKTNLSLWILNNSS